ncbi:MAG: hypothetical protein ACOYJD_05175 [Christensenellales bacterium]|jgi:hypothetical protein
MKHNTTTEFLHVMPGNNHWMYQFLQQMHRPQYIGRHRFLVLTNSQTMITHYPKMLAFKDLILLHGNDDHNLLKDKVLARNLLAAKHVIWHSFTGIAQKYAKYIKVLPGVAAKSIWIEWGEDIPVWDELTQGRLNQRFRAIGLTFPADEEFLKEKASDYRFFQTPMPFPNDCLKMIEQARPLKPFSSKAIRVQVFDGTLSMSQYSDTIQSLRGFADENIRIILPITPGLGWNERNYISDLSALRVLKTQAQEWFPDKLTVLTNPRPYASLLKYMWAVDIAVYCGERPLALWNILYMLYMGKKVFLPSSSPFYSFLKNCGAQIYDTDTISSMSFEEFSAPLAKREVPEFVLNYMDTQYVMEKWDELYSFLSSEQSAI